MSKRTKKQKRKSSVDHGKGEIKDNAVKALVKSKMFRPKTERDKTKYNRKKKHKKGRGDDASALFVFDVFVFLMVQSIEDSGRCT